MVKISCSQCNRIAFRDEQDYYGLTESICPECGGLFKLEFNAVMCKWKAKGKYFLVQPESALSALEIVSDVENYETLRMGEVVETEGFLYVPVWLPEKVVIRNAGR